MEHVANYAPYIIAHCPNLRKVACSAELLRTAALRDDMTALFYRYLNDNKTGARILKQNDLHSLILYRELGGIVDWHCYASINVIQSTECVQYLHKIGVVGIQQILIDASAWGNFRLFRYALQNGGKCGHMKVYVFSMSGPSVILALYASLYLYPHNWKERMGLLWMVVQCRFYKSIFNVYQGWKKLVARIWGTQPRGLNLNHGVIQPLPPNHGAIHPLPQNHGAVQPEGLN